MMKLDAEIMKILKSLSEEKFDNNLLDLCLHHMEISAREKP